MMLIRPPQVYLLAGRPWVLSAKCCTAVTATKKAALKTRKKVRGPAPTSFGAIAERATGAASVEIEGDRMLALEAVKSADSLDWNDAMAMVMTVDQSHPAAKVSEERKKAAVERTVSHSLAKLVAGSPTLQRLIDLGVDLASWEKQGLGPSALTLDFDADVAGKVRFLVDLGLQAGELGQLLTRAPILLHQSLPNLQVLNISAKVRCLISFLPNFFHRRESTTWSPRASRTR